MRKAKRHVPRLSARGAATRERIVAAAADFAARRGLGEMSLDDVMAASGASKSQLYHYFANKDELLLEVAALQAQRVLGTHRPLLAVLDSLEAMRNWRDAVLAVMRQGGCPLGALVYQLPPGARRARTTVEDGFDAWRGQIEDGLIRMRERGELAAGANAADIALAVLSAIQGGLLLSRSAKSNRPLEIAFDMALAHVATHMRRSDPPSGDMPRSARSAL